jgi:hypothetical protein
MAVETGANVDKKTDNSTLAFGDTSHLSNVIYKNLVS